MIALCACCPGTPLRPRAKRDENACFKAIFRDTAISRQWYFFGLSIATGCCARTPDCANETDETRV